ncbi:hypothetical protein [Aeoliella straminimaris]|nr:hypothetical protein [Aeoliella straminimaris]
MTRSACTATVTFVHHGGTHRDGVHLNVYRYATRTDVALLLGESE